VNSWATIMRPGRFGKGDPEPETQRLTHAFRNSDSN
jgi:hypothetical protein